MSTGTHKVLDVFLLKNIHTLAVFRIRIDPGFLNDGPDFKIRIRPLTNQWDQHSKWCFWLGVGGTWPKRSVSRVLNMKQQNFLLILIVLGRFFHGYRSGFFRIGSGFSTDPDSGKKVRSGSGKKPGSETLHSSDSSEQNGFMFARGDFCRRRS